MEIDHKIRQQRRLLATGEKQADELEIVLSEEEYQKAQEFCRESGFMEGFERNSVVLGVKITVK